MAYGFEGVDDPFQIVDAFTQDAGQPRWRHLPLLHRGQGRHERGSDAVVHVAHEALAFIEQGLHLFALPQFLVLRQQLLSLFAQAPFLRQVEFFDLGQRQQVAAFDGKKEGAEDEVGAIGEEEDAGLR